MRVPIMLRVVAVSACICSAADAQSRPRERALDVTIGAGAALRGEYSSSMAPAADAMFSVPIRQRWRGGVSFSAQAGLNINDCTVPIGGGSCAKPQPFVLAWSALFGHEWRARNGAVLRTLVGPSLVQQLQQGTTLRTTMGGASGRIDIVAALPVNVLFTIRATLAPALLQRARGTVAFGVGLGFH